MTDDQALLALQSELAYYKREYARLSKAHRKQTTEIIIGCYLIISIPKQMAYVGSSKNCVRRWVEHKSALKHGRHDNRVMQAVYDIYGLHGFDFRVIAKTNTEEESRALEKELIDYYSPQFNKPMSKQDPSVFELSCLIRGSDRK